MSPAHGPAPRSARSTGTDAETARRLAALGDVVAVSSSDEAALGWSEPPDAEDDLADDREADQGSGPDRGRDESLLSEVPPHH